MPQIRPMHLLNDVPCKAPTTLCSTMCAQFDVSHSWPWVDCSQTSDMCLPSLSLNSFDVVLMLFGCCFDVVFMSFSHAGTRHKTDIKTTSKRHQTSGKRHEHDIPFSGASQKPSLLSLRNFGGVLNLQLRLGKLQSKAW